VSRAVSVLGLSRRESWWKDAEILMLRHQLAVAQRERRDPCLSRAHPFFTYSLPFDGRRSANVTGLRSVNVPVLRNSDL
jgi:hypothetical protein